MPWHGPIVTVVYRFDELDRVEPLGDRVLQVLRRLVLAEADEALVALVAEHGIGNGRLADVAGCGADRLDVAPGGRSATKTPRASS